LTTSFDRVRWVGIAAAVITGLGTLMPWVVATDENAGVTVTPAGIIGGLNGLTCLVFAIIAIFCFIINTRFASWVAAGVGIVAGLLAATAIDPSAELLAYMAMPGIPHIGPGVWVSIGGAIGVTVVALYGVYALRET
jgi:hypothetical protein